MRTGKQWLSPIRGRLEGIKRGNQRLTKLIRNKEYKTMSNCKHNDFDEYFGVCSECKATRQEVLVDEFKNELQTVYGKMLKSLGIESGDVSPEQAIVFEQQEKALASTTANWLNNLYESEV